MPNVADNPTGKKTAAKKTTAKQAPAKKTAAPNRGVVGIITRIANEYGVPPEVALALAQYESGINPTKPGDGGHSIGLFQLYDAGLGRGMSVADREDPEKNARVALSHLAQVRQQHPNLTWGEVAAISQNPADHAAEANAVNSIVGDYQQSGQTVHAYFHSSAPAAAAGAASGGAGAGYLGGDLGNPQPLTVKQYLDDPNVQANYGYLSAFLHNPEIGPILAKAAKNGWGTNELLGALSQTEWWKKTSQTARSWQAQKKLDPATANQRLNQMTRQVQDLARSTLGYRLDDQRAMQMANTAIAQDWSQQDLQRAVGSEFHYQNNQQALRGAAGQTIGQFNQLAANYLVPISKKTIGQWTRGVLQGVYQPQDFEEYVKQQAESLYPTLKSALDAGTTVRQYLDPYAQLAAQTLEISPDSIDWMNPKWAKALNTTTPDGQRAPMSLSDWGTYLRSLPEYQQTQGAQQQAASFALQLANTFGKVST